MDTTWLGELRIDPIPAMLDLQNRALTYFIERDLLNQSVPSKASLWDLPESSRLLSRQQDDGCWKYAVKSFDPETHQNYNLLETYRTLGTLVEMYAFDRSHPAIEKAAKYIFSCQTKEGDIRGILGNEYMPYYHGAILELLIKAGYSDDQRTHKGLKWLLEIRQDDGGWIVPLQGVPPGERSPESWQGEPLPPDRSLPHAHMATGMVIRAFAVHPEWRTRAEIKSASNALKSRFFKPDKYNDRKAKSYWYKFKFPFWWANLLTALDSLSRIGLSHEDGEIRAALDWFIANQVEDGLWPTGYEAGRKAHSNQCWVALAVCRVFKRFYNH
jgi:hypothetical protein